MFEEGEGAFTACAKYLAIGFERGRGFPIEQCLDAREAFVGGGAEPAIGAHAPEAFGENVLKKAPNEVPALQMQALLHSTVAVGVLDGDAMSVIGKDGVLAHGGATDITRKVIDDMLARAHRLGEDVPGFAPNGTFESVIELGLSLLERALEEKTRLDGEAFDRKEELGVLSAHPSALRCEAASGDDVVNVRMILELSRPGVKDAEHA